MIRALIEDDKIAAARNLLATAKSRGELTPDLLRLQKVLAIPRVRRSTRTDIKRDSEYRWLVQHGRDYRGQWLAISGETLIAQAPTLKALRAQLDALKPDRAPLIHYVS
jgi:hypothetical protein